MNYFFEINYFYFFIFYDKLRQYGGKKGIGAEHLTVTLIDQIRKYQDDHEKLLVILNSYDWSSAFDKHDPTIVSVKY